MAKVSKKQHSAKSKSHKSASASTQAQNAAAQSKANAETTAQPGVIATIIEQLNHAKAKKTMVTASDILDALCKRFPQRKREGMMITVRAQLSRLPNEKDVKINRVREGRVVKYAAA